MAFMEKRTPQFKGTRGTPHGARRHRPARPGPLHRRASRTSGSPTCAPNAPVYHHPEPDGPGFWVITKHADVITCNRDAGTFSSDQARAAAWSGSRSGLGMQPARPRRAGGKLMLMMDPPDHTRYRKLVNRGFTPRMIGQLETAHPRPHRPGPRRGRGQGRRDRLRRRRRRRAAARGDRRAHRRAQRGPPQDLRVEQPHDRLRGPRVHRSPTRRCSTPRSRCSCTPSSWPSSGASEPARRHHHRAAQRRGRRRVAVGHGLQPLLPAAVGRRQRDDPQRHLPRDERVPREPRPVRSCSSSDPSATSPAPSRRSCGGRRRSCTSGATAPRTSSSAARRSRQATRSASGTSRRNRDEDVFDDPFRFDITRDPNPHIALRRRRSPLLPRRAARPHGDPRCCSRSWPSAYPRSRRSVRPTACAATSSAASSTCPSPSTRPDETACGGRRGALRRRPPRCRPPRGGGPAAAPRRRRAPGASRSGRPWRGCPSPRRRPRSRTGRR